MNNIIKFIRIKTALKLFIYNLNKLISISFYDDSELCVIMIDCDIEDQFFVKMNEDDFYNFSAFITDQRQLFCFEEDEDTLDDESETESE